MTAPMTAWMPFRGVAQRPTAETLGATVIWALALLGVGGSGSCPEVSWRSRSIAG